MFGEKYYRRCCRCVKFTKGALFYNLPLQNFYPESKCIYLICQFLKMIFTMQISNIYESRQNNIMNSSEPKNYLYQLMASFVSYVTPPTPSPIT